MLMSVDLTLSPVFKAGVPKVLFQAPIYTGGGPRNTRGREFWDIAPDGQRVDQHNLCRRLQSC
jgi:hypothetical protein